MIRGVVISRVAGITLLAAGLFGAALSVQAGGSVIDPCKVLTPAMATKLLHGKAKQFPAKAIARLDNSIYSGCSYSAPGKSIIGVHLQFGIFQQNPKAATTWSIDQTWTSTIDGIKVTGASVQAVAGVGNAAYWAPSLREYFVLKRPHAVTVVYYSDGTAATPSVKMMTGMAKTILKNFPA